MRKPPCNRRAAVLLAAVGTFLGGYITERDCRFPTAMAWVPALGIAWQCLPTRPPFLPRI